LQGNLKRFWVDCKWKNYFRSINSLTQFAGEPVGNFTVFHLGLEQVGFKTGAENSFHAGAPKTCSKFKPASLPESKSSKRRLSLDLISASERRSFSIPYETFIPVQLGRSDADRDSDCVRCRLCDDG